MKTTLNLLKTAAAATLLAAAGAQATTIDFDAASVTSQLIHLPNSYWGSSYVEDGFLLQSSAWLPNSLVVAGSSLSAGSYAMGATPLATTTLTGAWAFSIDSIDLRRGFSFSNWSVTFTGTKADASTVTQSFSLTNTNWNTFTFGAGFSNLTSLSWDEGALRVYAFDNINVTAVPEPETYAMMLAGLGMLGLARRRKSA